jgi:hypothetical protein
MVKNLNRQRHQTARQIDIVCMDLVAAQRRFVDHYKKAVFSISFYEKLLACTNFQTMLTIAAAELSPALDNANVSFFYRQDDKIRCFVSENGQPFEQDDFSDCFTDELVTEVINCNSIMNLNQLIALGLSATPSFLAGINAFTVPMSAENTEAGFILLWKKGNLDSKMAEYAHIIAPGLSHAISRLMPQPQSAD